jgi:hypothetical protein
MDPMAVLIASVVTLAGICIAGCLVGGIVCGVIALTNVPKLAELKNKQSACENFEALAESLSDFKPSAAHKVSISGRTTASGGIIRASSEGGFNSQPVPPVVVIRDYAGVQGQTAPATQEEIDAAVARGVAL